MNGSYTYPHSGGDAVGGIFAVLFSGCYFLFVLAFTVLIIAAMWRLGCVPKVL